MLLLLLLLLSFLLRCIQAVCLSSGERVICDKTKESCAHIFIPHERMFILVLETRRMV